MASPRPFSLVRTRDQWLRCSHQGTALLDDVVSLAWEEEAAGGTPGAVAAPAGLAFDAGCRLYHARPADGSIDRVLWAAQPDLEREGPAPAPLPLFAPPPAPALGDFTAQTPALHPLVRPQGLAVDGEDRLFVCDAGARRVVIVDLWERRVLRRTAWRSGGKAARPVDAAAAGKGVWVLFEDPSALVWWEAREEPRVRQSLPAGLTAPSRIAADKEGKLFVLDGAGTAAARVVPLAAPDDAFPVAWASDLDFDGEGALVVARRPGEDFLRFALTVASGGGSREELPALKARGYDGAGITATPDGRILFWTALGFRHAVPARLRYDRVGTVASFRLDSGDFQTVWGRIFVEACVPPETEVHLRAVAADEPPEGPTLPLLPPANLVGVTIRRPDLSPPLVPLELAAHLETEPWQRLHRRETGRELPWSPLSHEDHFEVYEAPLLAERGRYLWVTVELRGNGRRSPRLRALRAENPAHDLLSRLPAVFSRDDEAASFLLRFLSLCEGVLGELEGRSVARQSLVDARSAPAEVLPWLAGFVGLALDPRLTEERRRILVAAAVPLLRARGTVWGLRRFLEIALDAPVYLLEHFRMRGGGGPQVGVEPSAGSSRAVLGSGFRIGGAIGTTESRFLDGAPEDVFRRYAHRFTALVTAVLSEEERGLAESILAVHRPAHTIGELCTVAAGMRVGRGLLAGLTSVIGRSGGFDTAQVGGWHLGRSAVVGRPRAGSRLEASRLGQDSRVG